MVTARREGVRSVAFVGLGLLGCTPIYDNQYNDRANELEELRTEFLTEPDPVRLIASGQNRLFWAAIKRPDDQLFLHSIIPGDPASELEYVWSEGKNELDEYNFSELIAECSFGTSHAYMAGAPNAELLPATQRGGDGCAVDGGSIYFLVGGRAIRRWTPPTPLVDGDPDFLDLSVAGIAGQVAGFGVSGTLMVAVEQDGDLYAIDLVTKQGRWLRNDVPVAGSVFFDGRGIMYETNSDGPHYIELTSGDDDPPDTAFRDMVADGGYHLNFKHADVQTPSGNTELVIHDRHVIYRGERGIFAYGLDTRHVLDLLLDRGEGIDLEVSYHQPVVTNNQLFVRGSEDFSFAGDGPVYQVDLTGRLR